MMQYIRKAWLPLFLWALLSMGAAGPGLATVPCDFGDGVPLTRPNSEAGPTEVRTAFFIFDLVDINTVKQEFTLDFFVESEWKDPRLGEMLRKTGRKTCQTPGGSVWRPGMFIVNSRTLKAELPKTFYVHANGTVEAEQRLIGTFAAPFDLTDFPMDAQTLALTFISTRYGPDELNIIFEGGGAEDVFTESGWVVSPARAQTGVYEMELIKGTEEETEPLARFDYEIRVKRHTAYYIWKVLMPLCVIVFASWAIFWIDPTEIGVQTGIGTAMMLTVIAFLLSLQQVLPKISYLTRMDTFIYSALAFVFFAFAQALTTCTLAAHGRESVARRIDRWSRIVFPLAFAGLLTWFWCV